MQWYGIAVFGMHKATQRKATLEFETLATDSEDAKAKVMAAYDLSGLEIEKVTTHGKVAHLWPVIFKRGQFADDGPKDIWIVPRNKQKPM
jgi:hypothetical protein